MKISQKLTDAFNTYAGKIVNASEFDVLMSTELEQRLTEKQQVRAWTVMTGKTSKKKGQKLEEIMNTPEAKAEVAAATADGTSGEYEASQPVQFGFGDEYFDVNVLRYMLENPRTKDCAPAYPKDIEKKACDALATVLEKAHDYRDDVKQGKITLVLKP